MGITFLMPRNFTGKLRKTRCKVSDNVWYIPPPVFPVFRLTCQYADTILGPSQLYVSVVVSDTSVTCAFPLTSVKGSARSPTGPSRLTCSPPSGAPQRLPLRDSMRVPVRSGHWVDGSRMSERRGQGPTLLAVAAGLSQAASLPYVLGSRGEGVAAPGRLCRSGWRFLKFCWLKCVIYFLPQPDTGPRPRSANWTLARRMQRKISVQESFSKTWISLFGNILQRFKSCLYVIRILELYILSLSLNYF